MKFQNLIQFAVSSFPNRMANPNEAIVPLAVLGYAKNRVYFPNDMCAASAWITSQRNRTCCLEVDVAMNTPVRNFNGDPSCMPN